MDDHYSTEEGAENTDPASAMEAFFGNFGKMDIYAQIVIEEFIGALLNEKK
jgi:hypothetical protein